MSRECLQEIVLLVRPTIHTKNHILRGIRQGYMLWISYFGNYKKLEKERNN